MSASKEQQLFSHSSGGHVDVRIPEQFESEDGRCTLVLDTIGKEDFATWYDIWAALVAVDDMCMKFGKFGRAVEIGAFGRLFLDISFNERLI
ncbi:MAG: hypothetical protein Q9175_005026 [Cornicularia normoerica]